MGASERSRHPFLSDQWHRAVDHHRLATQQLLRDISATAQRMYSVGEGRQADVLRTQVEIDRMTEEIVRMSAMREALVGRLNALLDRSPDTAVGETRIPEFPAALPDRDSLIALALEQRPMLRAGQQRGPRGRRGSLALQEGEMAGFSVGAIYGQRRCLTAALIG
jgi:hypothetical protein